MANTDVEHQASISAMSNSIYSSDKTFKAYVLDNLGDPGLQSDNFCDIRSRYVIALKSPLKRLLVPQGSDGSSVILQDNLILVKRPTQLWINCPAGLNAGVSSSPGGDVTNLIRQDSAENVNKGSFNGFSQSDISPINRPYKLGEEITVAKLRNFSIASDFEFQSFFDDSPSEAGLPNIVGNIQRIGTTQPAKTDPNTGKLLSGGRAANFDIDKSYFLVTISKTAYENFISSFFPDNNYQPAANIPYRMEYYFANRQYLTFYCAAYQDTNIDNKARDASTFCLPTIVINPDSFLSPRERQTTNFYYTSA